MSDENQTTEGLPSPTTEPIVDPAPEPAPEPVKSGRFAVYNTTLEQYVGGVVEKKPSAAQAKALVPKGHGTEVREV